MLVETDFTPPPPAKRGDREEGLGCSGQLGMTTDRLFPARRTIGLSKDRKYFGLMSRWKMDQYGENGLFLPELYRDPGAGHPGANIEAEVRFYFSEVCLFFYYSICFISY